jgi:(p)ppGpp synthase/HD superfamily hydrolase
MGTVAPDWRLAGVDLFCFQQLGNVPPMEKGEANMSESKDEKGMSALERAVELATRRHAGQADKAGQPYLLHLLRVMHQVEGDIAKQAAVLHDVLEDTDATADELLRAGIDPQAVSVVQRLTRGKGDSYWEYVVRIAEDPIARQIKMADLNDNYRLDRVILREGADRATDLRRIERYILSYQFLAGRITLSDYRRRMAIITNPQESH